MGLRGQMLTRAEYFFDTDPGTGKGFPLNIEVSGEQVLLTTNIICSNLSEGHHHLFIRFCNEHGVWGQAQGRPFFKDNL